MLSPGKTLGVLGGGQLGRMFAHAAERLAHHKLPEDLVGVAAVPLTGAQKIDRRAARDLAR